MTRITKRDIIGRTQRIAELTGIDLTAEWAYGRPRIYYKNGSKELSPRLPTGQLYDWLNAFELGFEYGTGDRQ